MSELFDSCPPSTAPKPPLLASAATSSMSVPHTPGRRALRAPWWRPSDIYNLQLTLRFAAKLRTERDPHKALMATLRTTGSAVLAVTLVDVVAFGLLVFAPIPVVQQYGGIFALAIGLMFADTFVVLPVLLMAWARWRQRHGRGAAAPIRRRPKPTAREVPREFGPCGVQKNPDRLLP